MFRPPLTPPNLGGETNTQIAEKLKTMKKQRVIELAVKVIVAALTAFLTAIGTTSCLGHGPIAF